MVLFKRKAVQFLPVPDIPDENTEVWHIPKTGEIFLTYEEYMDRMEFYQQKRFICRITGRSGLTFFAALKSELAGAEEVEQAFPEPLKGPVLRKVQFKTVSRIDSLVDMVYEEFRDNFYPGEAVIINPQLPGSAGSGSSGSSGSSERVHAIIRDKRTRVIPSAAPGGEPIAASDYTVCPDDNPANEVHIDANRLSRDRKTFNKSVLRSFIKKTVTRESWNGAPWLVRHTYADKYHIDTRVPPELCYDTKLQERKMLQAQKRLSLINDDVSAAVTAAMVNGAGPDSPARLPDLKPGAKTGRKSGLGGPQDGQNGMGGGGHHSFVPGQFMHLPLPGNQLQAQMSIRGSHHKSSLAPAASSPSGRPRSGSTSSSTSGHCRSRTGGAADGSSRSRSRSDSKDLVAPAAAARPPPPPPPPPPPIKYPIEDLDVEPSGRRTAATPAFSVRPQLRFLCNDPPVATESREPYSQRIQMKTVGQLLETWDTLNVYCEIFTLDSFTFDDFVEAMCIASEEVPVQLFNEIHCSVLKVLVTAEAGSGAPRIEVALPDEPDEDDDEDGDEDGDDDSDEVDDDDKSDSNASKPGRDKQEEDDNDDGNKKDAVDPEKAGSPSPPAGRATRGSLARLEAERLAAAAAAADTQQQQEDEDARAGVRHRVEQVLRGFDWVAALARRQFSDGGWQQIMVGLLYRLSHKDRLRSGCEEILGQLVPAEIGRPTRETVRRQYNLLEVDLRVQALQILCMLTLETRAMRGYLDVCSETMTGYRKERIEWQRKRRVAQEEMLRLQREQRELLGPENIITGGGGAKDAAAEEARDIGMSEDSDQPQQQQEDPAGESTDQEDTPGRRNLRRQKQLQLQRKAREEEEDRRRKEKDKDKENRNGTARPITGHMSKAEARQLARITKELGSHEEMIRKCEEEVSTLENDLREADCPRTRVLGKDRFWNRYYWFERNGMPYGGLPTSSTASAGYANGRIWVQGPDELERIGYIDQPADLQAEHRARFGGLTVPDRKRRDEGATSLTTATQWGFLSEPEDLDSLLGWLDVRGFREMKLKKELTTYRDRIAAGMRNRRAYLEVAAAAAAATAAATADKDKNGTATNTNTTGKPGGVSSSPIGKRKGRFTRNRKTQAQSPPPPSPPPPPSSPPPQRYRSLSWWNSMAVDQIGHVHSEEPPPAAARGAAGKKRGGANANGKKREAAAAELEQAPARKTRRK